MMRTTLEVRAIALPLFIKGECEEAIAMLEEEYERVKMLYETPFDAERMSPIQHQEKLLERELLAGLAHTLSMMTYFAVSEYKQTLAYAEVTVALFPDDEHYQSNLRVAQARAEKITHMPTTAMNTAVN